VGRCDLDTHLIIHNLHNANGIQFIGVGVVRRRNHVSIILKNCCDPLFCGLAFWTIGYGLSWHDRSQQPVHWFATSWWSQVRTIWTVVCELHIQMSLACVAVTIVLGAMAERITFVAYWIFSFFLQSCFRSKLLGLVSNGFLRHMNAVISPAVLLSTMGGM